MFPSVDGNHIILWIPVNANAVLWILALRFGISLVKVAP